MTLGDLTGRKFGKLVVRGIASPSRGPHGDRLWVADCSCGGCIVRPTADLISRCRHCGCGFPKGKQSHGWKGCGSMSGSTLCMIRKTAQTKGYAFDLSCLYLWRLYRQQGGLCALSGLPITIRKMSQSRRDSLTSASLDRIDPKRGYLKGNVQWVCLVLNYMKRDLTQIEFIRLCKRVAERHE